MCGFAGRLYRSPRSTEHLEEIATRMNSCVRHRGPDGVGLWAEPNGNGVLAFSRLAIQDLSSAANQPMHSESGRYAIVYNGEIYNCDELRSLMGRNASSFRTHSDTEVLLACIEAKGLERSLQAANGMFAIALWDRKLNTVSLARDRLGKKPLHYAVTREHITFASEIKSILAVDDADRPISREAAQAYFSLTYVPGSLCIFEGIQKIEPGHILVINSDLHISRRPFWNLEEVIEKSMSAKSPSYEEAMEQTTSLLKDAALRRLVSDVPLGILLSGGTDSSLVAYTLVKTLAVPIQTFTIGLEDSALDESLQAKSIAENLGVENHCLVLSDSEALATVNSIVEVLDEPFGDGSAAATFALCKFARAKVTVLIGGDGGDEVFGGYTRYLYAVGWRGMLARFYAYFRRPGITSNQQVAVEIYRRLMTKGKSDGSAGVEMFSALANLSALPRLSVLQYLRYLDFKLYLPDDILAKIDRMSMANSVEMRSPLMDHRLIEESWTWDDDFLVHHSQRKRILRDMFSQTIGSELLQRKKYGFHSPTAEWLTGPLRPEMECIVEELHKIPGMPLETIDVQRWWSQLLHGDISEEQQLWNVYMYWRWWQRWGRTRSAS